MELELRARLAAKQTRREAQKVAKAGAPLQKQIQEHLRRGETAIAERKARELLQKKAMATQLDELAGMAEFSATQIQANNTSKRVMQLVDQASRIQAVAQRNMNPERTIGTLQNYQEQNEQFQMQNKMYQEAMQTTTATQVSDDAVHELLGKLADDAGVQLNTELNANQPSRAEPVSQTMEPTPEEEDALQQRLRALRA